MRMSSGGSRSSLTSRHRYKRLLPPLVFPVEETVTEGDNHLELRLLLRSCLKLELGDRATVGSDQFVYWNASDPKRCLSPDVFVCLGRPVKGSADLEDPGAGRCARCGRGDLQPLGHA